MVLSCAFNVGSIKHLNFANLLSSQDAQARQKSVLYLIIVNFGRNRLLPNRREYYLQATGHQKNQNFSVTNLQL